MFKSWTAVVLAGVLALSACTGGDDGTGGPSVTVDTPIGAPEKTTLKLALSAPNVDSQAPVFVALDKGFYQEEGLTIEIIDAQSIREGLVGGSLDLGVDNSVDLVQAAQADTGLKIVAGWRQREPFLMAASKEVTKPADLDGKQVVLGDGPGVPIVDVRLDLLKQSGFDLKDVKYKAVYPPGFSNAWVENFLSGQVHLTPLFPRHRPAVERAGGHLVLDEWKEWPNDSLAATEKWVSQNPNTLARFIRATLKGLKLWKDPKNQKYIQDLMVSKDFTVTADERAAAVYLQGPKLYDVDMGLSEDGFRGALEAQGLELPEMTSFVDPVNLQRAQKDLGLPLKPKS